MYRSEREKTISFSPRLSVGSESQRCVANVKNANAFVILSLQVRKVIYRIIINIFFCGILPDFLVLSY